MGACLILCCNGLTKPHAGDYGQNGIAYVLPYGGQPTSDGVTYEPSDASPGCCHPMYSWCCCQCCCCRGKPVSDYVNRPGPAYPPRQVMPVADTTSVQVADTTSVQVAGTTPVQNEDFKKSQS